MFHLKLYCQGLGFLFLAKTQETHWQPAWTTLWKLSCRGKLEQGRSATAQKQWGETKKDVLISYSEFSALNFLIKNLPVYECKRNTTDIQPGESTLRTICWITVYNIYPSLNQHRKKVIWAIWKLIPED